jgi:hypothetical protein
LSPSTSVEKPEGSAVGNESPGDSAIGVTAGAKRPSPPNPLRELADLYKHKPFALVGVKGDKEKAGLL